MKSELYFLSCLALLTTSQGQDDGFLYPATSEDGEDWRIGSTQSISWEVPWSDPINLVIYPGGGSTSDGIIVGSNVSNDDAPETLDVAIGTNIYPGPWYLFAVGQDGGGDISGKSFRSPELTVREPASTLTVTAEPETTTSSTTTTSTETTTTTDASPTGDTSPTGDSQPQNEDDEEPSSSSSGMSEGSKVGLGVGIGLGVPLLAAIIVAAFLFRRKRSHQYQPAMTERFGTEIPDRAADRHQFR